MIIENLTGSGGDSVLFARCTGGDSVLVNKKEWGGFCPGGILSYTPLNLLNIGSVVA